MLHISPEVKKEKKKNHYTSDMSNDQIASSALTIYLSAWKRGHCFLENKRLKSISFGVKKNSVNT